MRTEYKRPGSKPSKVVLTAAVRADLKNRGFREVSGGQMTRNIGKIDSQGFGVIHIDIWENGHCHIHLTNRFHPIEFSVDAYWVPSILYIAQMELNKDAAKIRQEAEVVVGYAEMVMDVVCGKTK